MLEIPWELAKRIAGCEWITITIGRSDAKTFYLRGEQDACFLKIQSKKKRDKLHDEMQRMKWLQTKLPVPEILFYGQDEENEYLLMTEIKGLDASHKSHLTNIPHLMKILAKGLRKIHDTPVADCPFQQRLDVKLVEARKRVEQQLVDESDFDEDRKGRKVEELFQELLENCPKDEDLVLTHGDYCLPNIIIDDQSLGGFIDVGRFGIADRYQDLALAIRSITHNIGKRYVPLFLAEYGLAEIDHTKVIYYQLLDEFF